MKHGIRKLLHSILLTVMCMSAQAGASELFGLGQQTAYLPASSFRLINENCAWHGIGWDYLAVVPVPGGSCPSGTYAITTLDLPEGALISWQRVYYSNTSGKTITILLALVSVEDISGNSPQITTVSTDSTQFNSGGAIAKQYNYTTPTVFDTYDVRTAPAHRLAYVYFIGLPGTGDAALKGILVGYRRQIAPAPASATYTDVPTSHPFFNEIAQLSKSGITQGCGNGQFCPDSPVTRGQMATFLSRALGLQWDWNTDAS